MTLRSNLRALAVATTALFTGCDGEAVESDVSFVATKPPRQWEVEPVREGNLRFATLNIRNFPSETFGLEAAGGAGQGGAGMGGSPVSGGAPAAPVRALDTTDQEMLLDLLEKLDFDVLAVQEIRDPASLDGVLRRLEERTGRTYASAYSTNELSGNDQRVGLLVDAGSVDLSDAKEHASIDVTGTLRAGLSARVVSRKEQGVDLSVLVLHLASGESVKRAGLRAQQAAAASAVAAELAASASDEDVMVLGDLNTAREEAEYGALDAAFASSLPIERHDNPSGCTSYFVKNKLGTLAPSTIDQVLTASLDELDSEVPIVSGAHCYERSCTPFESDGPETGTTYWGVSDHCPVYFELRDADLDG